MSAAPLPPAKPATRTPRTLRNAIFCLALAAFASGSSLRLTDSLLPRLANDFQISLGTASYTITAFSIAYGLAQLLFGPLGDRFGKYLTIAAACAAGVVTTVLCALAPSFPLLLVARFLAGCTAAAVIPLSMAWIGDVIPYEDRQPVLARFLIGQILGLSSGVLIGGWAADHSSWRLPFFAIALLYAAVSAILFSLNRQLPAEAKRTVKSTGPAIPRMISEFGQVLAKPWARVVLASVFMEGMFLYGAFAFIASHLHHVHGMSLTAAGSMVMLFGLGGFLFALGSGVLVRRLGEVWLVRVGGLVAAVALVTIGLAPDWTWVIPACGALGLGFYMLHNTLQINATQMAPERRGAAVASFASCFFLGQSSGIAMAAWLIASFGTSAVIAGFGMGLLLVAWIFSLRKARYLAKSEL
jgi:predicted MFS family arabinose efflux permease